MMNNKRSLFICLTPLQILIANKLIEVKKEQSDVLILTYNLNEKYSHYIDIISNNGNTNQVSTIKIDDSTVYKKLNTLKKIMQWCSVNRYNIVYLASIDNFFMHAVLTYSKAEKVYTFDDGTANIVPNSSYFIKKDSFINKLARFVFGIKWDLCSIKQRLIKHYTIYKGIKNIVDKDRIEFIDVFSYDALLLNEQSRKEIYIYLGQPFRDKMVSIDTYKKLTNTFTGLKYYLHPREEISNVCMSLTKSEILQSNLIIEDYIYSLLQEGYSVKLFTISSSAGFNLYFNNKVEVNFIIVHGLDEIGDVYHLILENKFRILEL